MSLRQKTISGVLWTGAAKMSMQVVLVIVQAVLARLLSKADFGIVGMAGLITVAIGMVNDKGLGTAIIQKKEIKPPQLSTMFWVSVMFGLLLYGASAAASIPISLFFQNRLVKPVILVIALGFFIGGFAIVHKSLLTRQMQFKKLAIIEISSVTVSGIIAVILAFHNFGVWSLVANVLLRDAFTVIGVWMACTWRPNFHFALQEFKEFYRFSSNVLTNDVMIYLVMNADITIIGRILGEVALGIYNWALYLVKLPVQRISGIVAKVVFPAFSHVQNDIKRFKAGYLRSMTFISLITFPMLIALGVFAREFIIIFLTEKWIEVVIPLQILVPMAMLKSVGTIKGSVLMAVGRPDIELKWNVFYLLPLIGAVWFGTRWGLIGVAASFSALYLVTWPIIQDITNRQINVSPAEFLSAFSVTGPATASMLVFGYVSRWLLKDVLNFGDLIVLLLGLLIAGLCYIVSLQILDRTLMTELRNLFIRQKATTEVA